MALGALYFSKPPTATTQNSVNLCYGFGDTSMIYTFSN